MDILNTCSRVRDWRGQSFGATPLSNCRRFGCQAIVYWNETFNIDLILIIGFCWCYFCAIGPFAEQHHGIQKQKQIKRGPLLEKRRTKQITEIWGTTIENFVIVAIRDPPPHCLRKQLLYFQIKSTRCNQNSCDQMRSEVEDSKGKRLQCSWKRLAFRPTFEILTPSNTMWSRFWNRWRQQFLASPFEALQP